MRLSIANHTIRMALAASSLVAFACSAADVDLRPPDKLALSVNGSRLVDVDDGGGGSLNWLHYFTPDAVVGLGAEHQTIADSQWSFGSVRGSVNFGDAASRFSVFGEMNYGNGDESNRDFNYSVAVLGLSQSFTSKFSVQLEGRQIDIDTTHGNLPKLGLTYVWTPHFVTNVAYAKSVGGNLGTELMTARMDHYGPHVNLILGGATGQADPSVINLQPGLRLPTRNLKEGFAGIGRTFRRGEVQLLGDYLKLADSKKITITLSFTAYLGSHGLAP
jgi:hypothetical protein